MENHGFDFSKMNLPHEHVCLDFVNTTSNHHKSVDDNLKHYADLVSWALDVKLLNSDEAMRLWQSASQQLEQAAQIHQKAVVLREAIYRILLAVAHDQNPDPADLDMLNVALNEAMAHMRLLLADGSFGWTWEDAAHLDGIYWRAAWSAGELLMSDQLQRVRQCEGCQWFFLDMGRGRKRRWCDMNTCGNRAKARRHYLRTKGK